MALPGLVQGVPCQAGISGLDNKSLVHGRFVRRSGHPCLEGVFLCSVGEPFLRPGLCATQVGAASRAVSRSVPPGSATSDQPGHVDPLLHTIPGGPHSLGPISLHTRIRWNQPVPDHDAPYAGRSGAWGAGPILMPACFSHSPARRSAPPGSCQAAALGINPPSAACLYSDLLSSAVQSHSVRSSHGMRHGAGLDGHGTRRDLTGFDIAPECHQQLAGKRHDHHLADASLGPAGACQEPPGQIALRRQPNPAPGLSLRRQGRVASANDAPAGCRSC
jgi:hypothetical protein